ncbi:MAG: hypothetical protein ABI442_09505 [Gemmatimonadaceae bacterium]
MPFSAIGSAGDTRSALRILAGYWRLAFRRTWKYNSSNAILGLALIGALTRGITNRRALDTPLRATTSLAIALAVTALLSAATRRSSLFRSLRFSLASIDGDALLAARVLFGNPLRTLATACVIIWGSTVAIAAGHGVLSASLDLAYLLAAVAGVVVFDEWCHGGRTSGHAWWTTALGTGFVALVLWAMWLFESPTHREPQVPGIVAGALFTASTSASRIAWIAIAWLSVGALAWAARRDARTNTRAIAAGRSRPNRGGDARALDPIKIRRFAFVSSVAPWLPCEVAILSRFAYGRLGLFIAFVVASVAFLRDAPAALAFITIGWLGAMHNLFGVDLPNGAVLRHTLAGVGDRRVMHQRHVTMTAATIVVAIATIGAFLAASVVVPALPTPARLAPYAMSLAYGVSVYFLFTVESDYISLRYPRPVYRQLSRTLSPEHAGSASASLAILAAWSAMLAVAVVIVVISARITEPWRTLGDLTLPVATGFNFALWRVGSWMFGSDAPRRA